MEFIRDPTKEVGFGSLRSVGHGVYGATWRLLLAEDIGKARGPIATSLAFTSGHGFGFRVSGLGV